jgi:uncharacterized protein YndB with AHSA1/START domain
MNPNFVAQAETTIKASPARVWAALTQPELIRQYLFGTQVQTDWQVGSPITYSGEWQGKPYQDKGKILEVAPEQRLVSTFWSALSGQPDRPEFYTTVHYELTSQGEATRLVVTQAPNASQAEADHSAQNWKMVLDGLKKMLEG